VLILCYHNVVNGPLDEFDRKSSRVHVDQFAEQMREVAREFHPISLEAMLSMLRQGETDPKAVAVTFDDGFYGVVAHALPVLKDLGIPATIFVVTDYVRERERFRLMHFDEMEIAFRLTSASSLDLGFIGERAVSLGSARARVDGMKRVKRRLKLVPDAERQHFHQEVLKGLGVEPQEALTYAESKEKYRTVTWEELRDAKNAGLSTGSHTCSHRVLSRLERSDLEHEVLHSLTLMRKELDDDFLPFAYPYGSLESIGTETPALVRQAGFSCGLTTEQGSNTPDVDHFLLRRVEFESLDWAS
jgi:peptidoglycan/xylan/chitin deacetylase (PgdA/CDA1 family)